MNQKHIGCNPELGLCLDVVLDSMPFYQAALVCMEMGGSLLTAKTWEVWEYVKSELVALVDAGLDQPQYWLGLESSKC